MTKTQKTLTAVIATLAVPVVASTVAPVGLVAALSLALPFVALGHLEGAVGAA